MHCFTLIHLFLSWDRKVPISGMYTMPPAGRNAANCELRSSAAATEPVTWSICGKAVAMKKLIQSMVTDTWQTRLLDWESIQSFAWLKLWQLGPCKKYEEMILVKLLYRPTSKTLRRCKCFEDFATACHRQTPSLANQLKTSQTTVESAPATLPKAPHTWHLPLQWFNRQTWIQRAS